MNPGMVKPEKFGHLHLNYHFTVPLKKLTEIKNDVIFIFTLFCGASERFYLFEAPKRNVKIKNVCHFPLLFHRYNKC